MAGNARYDEHVVWYADFRPGLTDDEVDVVGRFLGKGAGRCLDVGCGTGVAFPILAQLGWTVVGVDVSAEMLARAREHDSVEVHHARAESLPFASASFDAAVSIWTHTDVDDFGGMLSEVSRVLRPEARFVYVGAHPCFVGPHSRFIRGEGIPELHPGYHETDRYERGPAVGPDGLRARLGATHLPLARFLQCFVDAELRLDRVEELPVRDHERAFPYQVALLWRR